MKYTFFSLHSMKCIHSFEYPLYIFCYFYKGDNLNDCLLDLSTKHFADHHVLQGRQVTSCLLNLAWYTW